MIKQAKSGILFIIFTLFFNILIPQAAFKDFNGNAAMAGNQEINIDSMPPVKTADAQGNFSLPQDIDITREKIAPMVDTNLSVVTGVYDRGNKYYRIYQSKVSADPLVSLPALAVTRTTPRAGQAGVFPNTDIMVTFNQAIQKGASFAAIRVTDATGQSVYATYDVWGDTLTIKPNTLAYDTLYTVTLPAGSIDGTGGKTLAAAYTFSFTTKFVVAGTYPADQASGVAINKPVTVDFSNIVKEGPNFSRISLYPADDPGAPVPLNSIQLSGIDNNTRTRMTITYQGILAPAADYRMSVPAGSVEDVAGHRLDADYSFDFQTQRTLTLPQVFFSEPSGGAAGVSLNQAISITFSEDIVEGPNYNSVALTVYQSGAPVAVNKQIVSDQLIITPAAALSYATTYAVSIPAGAVADAVYGNLLKAPYEFTFTTKRPMLVGTSPANRERSVYIDTAPSVIFDQPVTGAQLDAIVLRDSGGNQVPAKGIVDDETLIIVPSQLLKPTTNLLMPEEQYTVEVPAGTVLTRDGIPNDSCSFSFTTGSGERASYGPDYFFPDWWSPTQRAPYNFNGWGIYYADKYMWDFGDGDTGTGRNVSHTYANAGHYTATLLAKQQVGPNSWSYFAVRQAFDVKPAPPPPPPPPPPFNPETATLTVQQRFTLDELPGGGIAVAPGQSVDYELHLSDGAAYTGNQKIEVYVGWNNQDFKLWGTPTTDGSGYARFTGVMPSWVKTGSGYTVFFKMMVGDKIKATSSMVIPGMSHIQGYVRLQMLTGRYTGPPAGTTVVLDGGKATAPVDSDGYYQFNSVTSGTHRVKASAPGWEPAESTVEVGADESVNHTIILDKGVLSESEPGPVVRRFSPYGAATSTGKPAFFLRDSELSNIRFSVDVDWKGHYPAYVKVVSNSSPPVEVATFSANFSTGEVSGWLDLNKCPPGPLEVYAISGEGYRSEMVSANAVVVSLNNLPGGLQVSSDEYRWIEFKFNPAKVQYTIPVSLNLPTFVTPAISEIPVISDAPAKLVGGETEGTVVLGPGGLVVTVPDQPGMTAGELGDIVTLEKYGTIAYKGAKKLAGKKSPAQVGMILIQFSRSVLDKYTYDLATGSWVRDAGISNFITDVEAYYSRSFVPFKDKKVKDMFKKYGASMDLTFTLAAQMNSITETKLQDGALVTVGGQQVLQIPLAEIDGGVSAAWGAASGYLYVSLTGDSVIVWNEPDGPTKYYLDLVGGAKVSLAGGLYTKKWDFLEYKWGSPITYSDGKWRAMYQGMSVPSGDGEPQDSESLELTPASRDYLGHQSGWLPASGNPVSTPRKFMAASSGSVSAAVYDGAVVTPLQNGIFPESAQDVISTGNGAFMVLLLDNPAHDAMNRTQVNYSIFDGSAWSVPQPITPADNTGDFNPVVAQVASDTLSVAWRDLKPGITDSTSPSELMSSTEIAVSNYDTATRQWGTVQKFVYGENRVNLLPTIAGGNNKGLLVWVASPEVSGFVPSGSESIVFSRYDGSTWSVPEAVYTGLSGIVSSSLAYNNDGTGIYAFSKSNGEVPGLANQIYIIKYDGTKWGSPIEVTNNAEENANPQVTYVDGRPLLVWWSDGRIVYCDDLDTLAVRVAEASGAISKDFTLAHSDSLQLVEVVCAGRSANGRDLYTVPYDAASGLWGSAAKLVAAGALLRSPSAAFVGGHLVTVYNKDNLVPATSDSGQVYQAVGDTDLFAAQLPVVHKLSIPADGLSVLQGNVMAGGLATVSAQVYNTGSFTENNIAVGFYDGDPGNGGEAIGSATIPGPLAPGAGAVVQLDWLVPSGQVTHEVYAVVDPLRQIPIADRSRSKASLRVVQPDLALQLNYDQMAVGQYAVSAQVTNTSGIDITGATLTLSGLNHTTGNLDIITTKPLNLAVRQSIQIPVLWQATADYVYQGEAVILGEINPPAGVRFYSGDSIEKGLVIPIESLTVTAFPPLDNVPVSDVLVLKFNDVISPGAGTVTLATGGGAPVAITTSMAGNVLTITPQVPLAYNTGYTLTVQANAVAGQAGDALAADFVRSFTTEGSTPALLVNNLSGVPVAGTLTIPFTGTIKQGAAFGTLTLRDAAQRAVDVTPSVSANMLKIAYAGLAYGVAYTVDIPNGALASGLGDSLAGQTLVFQTVAESGQKVATPTATPASGSIVANNSTVTLATTTAGATIYYTTDSITPTTGSASGTLVSISGQPGERVTVQALAVAEGYEDSDIASFSYTIQFTGSGGGSSDSPAPVSSSTGSALVSPAGGGTVSLGDSAKVIIPPGALQGTGNAAVTIRAAGSPPSTPPGFIIQGQVYRFTVNGQDHYTFNQLLTLTFAFDPSRVPAGETPTVSYYDDRTSKWVNLGGTVTGNLISVQVDHFTDFAVMTKTSAPEFADVAGTWAQGSIAKLVARGAIAGYPDGTFRPDNDITRAEFATVMVKALQLVPKDGPLFVDTRGTWAQSYVSTAAAYGIVNGYDATSFGPNDQLTREQMTAMVVRASHVGTLLQQIPGGYPSSGQLPFRDAASINAWAREYVATAVKDGLVNGYGDGSFRPLAYATRAEAVTVVVRVVQPPQAGTITTAAASAPALLATIENDYFSPVLLAEAMVPQAAVLPPTPPTAAAAGSGIKGDTVGVLARIATASLGHPLPSPIVRSYFAQAGAPSAVHFDQNQLASAGINSLPGYLYTVAGDYARYGTAGGYGGDGGPAAAAGLIGPAGVAVDASGNLYIADTVNNVIREVAASDHTQWGIAMKAGHVYTVAGSFNAGYSGDGSRATAAELNSPMGVAVDASGNLYIADMYNSVIRKVAASDHTQWGIAMKAGDIYTVAGNYNSLGGGYGGDGAKAAAAELNYPTGVAVDAAGNLYIADMGNSVIRQVAGSNHTQWGIAMQAGDIYTVAGDYARYRTSGGYSGDGGPATAAGLSYPNSVAVDVYGNLYLADSNNNVIRVVDGSQWGQSMQAGTIYTVSGDQATGGSYGGDGGPATAAALNYPNSVAVDVNGNLYLADSNNNVIREVAARDGTQWGQGMTAGAIYTVAGDQAIGGGYSGDGGSANAAGLNWPAGVAVNPDGDIYLADAANNIIRVSRSMDVTVAASQTGPAVGSTASITVTIKDGKGNPVSGQTVVLTSTGSAQITTVQGTTQDSGIASFSVTDAQAETVTLTVRVGTLPVGTVQVTFWGIQITAPPVVGVGLTGALTPAGATATYQWRAAATATGAYTDIAGATGSSYTPTAADLGRYLVVVATGTGDYTGSVTSAAVGPVATPLTGIGAISGTLQVGLPLTAMALTPAGATATYQWRAAATATGDYTNITGATGVSYTPAAADLGRYLVVVATGNGSYTGSVTSAAIGPVTAALTGIGAISGTPEVGSMLTAGVLSPAGATASYQWEEAPTVDGTYTAIAGATESSYTVVAAAYSRYLRVIATGTGDYTGSVTSAAVGPVAAQALMGIGAISGTPEVGSMLTAGALSPAGATASYQWEEAPTVDGTYTAIAGATESSYTVVAAAYSRYLRVIATGTGDYTGSVTSAAVGPVAAQALMGIGAISGTPEVGSMLTAGALTPAGATASCQWEEAPTADGTYTAIDGATESSYTVVAADYGRYLRVVATGTGAYMGSITSGAISPVAAQALAGIGAISGTPQVGSMLTAGALSPAGATGTYQWQEAAAADGPYSAIAGATESSYTVVAAAYGRYLKVVATGTGAYTGSVTSAAIGPVAAQPLTAVAVSGTPQVGSMLTAGALTPAGATASYQWEEAPTADGTYTAIAGATESSYTMVGAAYGRYLKVVATGTGAYTGSVTSGAVGPVAAQALTGIGAISGTPQVGANLTAVLTPAGATATYQWEEAPTDDGTYTAITGATESSYTVVAAAYGRYLRVLATGTNGYTGSVTSAAVGPVVAQPLTAATVSGTPHVGATLTAVLSPAGATGTYQWQEAAAADGPYSAIAGAAGSSYTPQMADVNQYLRVVATGSGGYSGSVTSAAAGPVSPWDQLVYSPSIITLNGPGNTQQIALTAKSSETEINITTQAQWSTENAEVATVNGTGLVSSVDYGTTNIVASYAGLTVHIPVEVSTIAQYFTFDSVTGTITDYNTDGGANVVIPSQIGGQTVTSIGDNAFEYKGLTSVTIPESVITIKDYAFWGNNLTAVTIPGSVATIGSHAFENNSDLNSLTIGSGVQSIGEYAFADCSQLTSVVIPDSVTSIGEGAFYYDYNLSELIIGTGITTIAPDAFAVTKLTSLVIPDNVISIGRGAFADGLIADLTIGTGVANIDENAFYNNNLQSLVIPNNVIIVGDGAFEFNPLTNLTIGNNVTNIGARAFRGTTTTNLASVVIPDSVITIGDMAFRNTKLVDITMGNGLTSIGAWAFADNSTLTSVIIPNSVTSIGSAAFLYDTNLETITIGPNVTYIGNQLIHLFNNYFRDAYFNQETGGAGMYTGTYDGAWTKTELSR